MAETANALGIPATFPFEGRDYKIGPRSLRVEGEIERRLQDLALAGVQQMRPQLRGDDYRLMIDGLRRDYASRVYSWGSESCIQFLSSLEGIRHLAMLQLADSNPGDATIGLELINRIWADSDAWEAMRLKFEQVEADPNRKRAT